MEKQTWRIIRIFIVVLTIIFLGSSIIFDIIFYISKWYPHLILRIIITYLLIELILRFTWFGKELEEFIKKKLNKSKKKK